MPDMKICNKCGCEYPLKMFIRNKHCKNGRAGTCRICGNEYSRNWKRENRDRLAPIRRKRYAEKYGAIQREKERIRKEQHPLRVRCQLLRGGMRERARLKHLEFDSDYFTVPYLMSRLSGHPNCECCGKKLDVGFKADKKFNDASPSMDRVDSTKGYTRDNVAILCWQCNKHKQDATAEELRRIADFMDTWGFDVENTVELVP